MSNLKLLLPAALVAASASFAVPPPPLEETMSTSQQAIQGLDSFVGDWSAVVSINTPDGDKATQQHVRSVKRINDSIYMVFSLNGNATALYVLDFDPTEKRYRVFRPGYLANRSSIAPQPVYAELAGDGSLIWSMPYTAGPNLSERIQTKINIVDGHWHEIEQLIGLPSRQDPILSDIFFSKVMR